jgi:uncharacterized protein (TIGR02452 family)
MNISRNQAREYGEQALRIIQSGGYRSPEGRKVSLSAAIERAVHGTVAYPPETRLTPPPPARFDTQIEVCNETTLSAARRLLEGGSAPAVLNFASGTHPGGGFLEGARAQEEYLARSSALFACLKGQPMYAFHRRQQDAMYTSYMLYSPEVPVFCADDGSLLEEPYTVSVISAAAPNRAYLANPDEAQIEQAFRERIAKLLWIGLQHGHEAIVLGAWGCGSFGNDSRMVSRVFAECLLGEFRGAYRRVVFAILDWSDEKRFIAPFEAAFTAARGA